MARSISEKRKRAEQRILALVNRMTADDPTKTNEKIYLRRFAAMTDEQFDAYMRAIHEKKRQFDLYVPNMKVKMEMETLLQLADEFDVKLLERVWLWDSATQRYFLTTEEYFIGQLPTRRLKQYLFGKISVPDSDSKIDMFTGQVVKPDKGASVSQVEIQTLLSKNLTKTIAELSNIRGGNINAYAEFKSNLLERGESTLTELDPNTRVRSAYIAGVYLNGQHIANNL